MKIQPFNTHHHASLISEWLVKRGLTVPKVEQYPKVGFIVRNHREQPIAAGHLRMVEGGYAQLDGLVSNPDASPKDRNQALDLVVETLLNHAKQLGITEVISFTIDKSIEKRSTKHGFKAVPHRLIVVDLNNKPGALS